MNKIILSAAVAAALFGAGGAFAQSAECQGRLPDGRSVCDVPNRGGLDSPHNNATLMGGVGPAYGDGERHYRRNDVPRFLSGAGLFGSQDEYRRNRNDRDGDGIRDRRDADRDGDGVRNNRDRYPDDRRYR